MEVTKILGNIYNAVCNHLCSYNMKMYALCLTSIIVQQKPLVSSKVTSMVEVNLDYYLRNRYMSVGKSILPLIKIQVLLFNA